MKRINLSWIDGRDIHYLTNDPTLAHVESLGQKKASSQFFEVGPKSWCQISAT